MFVGVVVVGWLERRWWLGGWGGGGGGGGVVVVVVGVWGGRVEEKIEFNEGGHLGHFAPK